MTQIKLLVAFTTRLVDGFTPDVSKMEPPANYKNEDAIARWRMTQAEKAVAEALLQPYTATFDEVQIADVANQDQLTWNYRAPGGAKQAACLAVRGWLLKHHAGAWPNVIHPRYEDKVPPVVFIGFDPKLFLEILAHECSFPENQPKEGRGNNALPLSMWYGNTDNHRDIGRAVGYSDDNRFLDWGTVLRRRGQAGAYPKWAGPHADPSADLELTTIFAGQLGMLAVEEK